MSAETLFRFIPWLAVVLVGIISLVPGTLRPHTGLPGPAEHFLAYSLAGFVLAIQAHTFARKAAALALLCLYSGSLEVLQIWVPGRDPDFIDFLASSSGAFCGIAFFAMIRLLWQRRSGKGAGAGNPAEP